MGQIWVATGPEVIPVWAVMEPALAVMDQVWAGMGPGVIPVWAAMGPAWEATEPVVTPVSVSVKPDMDQLEV